MSKNVVDELLVSLGLENDRQSFEEGSRLFDGVRGKALLFGGAIASVAYGSTRMVMNFAEAKDQLGKFQDATGVSASFVDGLGFALEKAGGQAEEAFGSVDHMLDLMQRIRWGELNGLKESMSSGIDFAYLGASQNMEEAYLRLSEMVGRIQGSEQQRNVMKELGFSQAEMVLLKSGPQQMRDYFDEAAKLAPVTAEMTARAADLNTATSDLAKAVTGITDELSVRLAPRLSDFSQQLAYFLAENRGLVGETYDNFISDTSAEIEGFAKWLDALGNGDINKLFQQTEGAIRYLFTGDSKPAPAPEGFWDYSVDDTLGALPPPSTHFESRESATNNHVEVHVNGARSPEETAFAVRKTVMEVLRSAGDRAVERTERDFR
ncbi:MAG: hypothetical protein P1U64_04010 [Alcanivoracaceae bacterium]|nr:hypothetical protein [Alcanivoracaceae bacterium]